MTFLVALDIEMSKILPKPPMPAPPPSCVAIGVFDGVHLGHQVLFNRTLNLSREHTFSALGLTFDPHPAKILAPSYAPKMLETIEARKKRLLACGLSKVEILPFSKEFSSTKPQDFIETILYKQLNVRHVVVGDGFVFGAGQSGNVETLRQAGAKLGFEVHALPVVRVEGIVVSSTKIREFIAEGNIPGARLLLGRPPELAGTISPGDGRGKAIGFATANLQPDNELLPPAGVYAAWALGPFGKMPSVVNIGFAPTFNRGGLKTEIHILDFVGKDLYGEFMVIQILTRLRGERRFDNVDSLRSQISEDIRGAREIFENTKQ